MASLQTRLAGLISAIKSSHDGLDQRVSDLESAGGMVRLSAASADNDAVIDFTAFDAADFDDYRVILTRLKPATDGTNLGALLSQDGGSTWDAGASDYYHFIDASSASGNRYINADAADNRAALTIWTGGGYYVGNTGTGEQGVSGELQIKGMHDALQTEIASDLWYRSESGLLTRSRGLAVRSANAATNGLRISFATGNALSGEVTLFGIPKA